VRRNMRRPDSETWFFPWIVGVVRLPPPPSIAPGGPSMAPPGLAALRPPLAPPGSRARSRCGVVRRGSRM
jgi:hypothetical protein